MLLSKNSHTDAQTLEVGLTFDAQTLVQAVKIVLVCIFGIPGSLYFSLPIIKQHL